MTTICIDLLAHAAVVAMLATLISESKLLSPVREKLNWDLLYCPVCLSYWLSALYLWFGVNHYFLTLALSQVWILVVLKVYAELDKASE